jgi:hypothetical protein
MQVADRKAAIALFLASGNSSCITGWAGAGSRL